MEATIREGQAPAVIVSLQQGERLTSEAGAMTFVSGDISMEVEMPAGLGGALKRKLLARLQRDDDRGRLALPDLGLHGYPLGAVAGADAGSWLLRVVHE